MSILSRFDMQTSHSFGFSSLTPFLARTKLKRKKVRINRHLIFHNCAERVGEESIGCGWNEATRVESAIVAKLVLLMYLWLVAQLVRISLSSFNHAIRGRFR